MYLQDFYIGMTMEIPPVVIERGRMLEFAEVYDPLPLHCDEGYAAKTRFGGLIAPGVMSFMTVWAKFLESGVFGDELVAGKSTRIEWCKPVYPEDVLHGTVTVTGLSQRNAFNGIVETTLEAFNQNGALVLTNVTETVVQCK